MWSVAGEQGVKEGAWALNIGVDMREVGEKHGAEGEKHGEFGVGKGSKGLLVTGAGLGEWFLSGMWGNTIVCLLVVCAMSGGCCA